MLYLGLVLGTGHSGPTGRHLVPSARPKLTLDDPMIAATQFNWLVMGDPVNRAMFFGAVHLSASEQQRHLTQSVRVFLAAYRRLPAAD